MQKCGNFSRTSMFLGQHRESMGNAMKDVQILSRYKAWADDLFLATVSTVPDAELVAPRPIIFGSLIRTLNHSYSMDYVWQCHLLGKPHGLTTRNPQHSPGIAELTQRQRSIDEWYVSYADSITETELEQIIGFDFIGGGSGRMSRREIILHVVNHTTYHRGQAASILYYLGVVPPATDMPVFLRQHPSSGSAA
jgi:uncharacterized damage-inducible protein DinB